MKMKTCVRKQVSAQWSEDESYLEFFESYESYSIDVNEFKSLLPEASIDESSYGMTEAGFKLHHLFRSTEGLYTDINQPWDGLRRKSGHKRKVMSRRQKIAA